MRMKINSIVNAHAQTKKPFNHPSLSLSNDIIRTIIAETVERGFRERKTR